LFEPGQQFGRQIVLQQVDLAAQQLQYPHSRIADAQEFDSLAVVYALELQATGFRPVVQPERAAAQRLTMKRVARTDCRRRKDADDQVTREQRVCPVQEKIQGVGVDDTDVPDQAQGRRVRRCTVRRQDGTIGCLHIAGSQRRAVVEPCTLPVQPETVVYG